MNAPRLFQRIELYFWNTAIDLMLALPYLPRRMRRLLSVEGVRQLELPRWVFIAPAIFVVLMLPALLLVAQLPAAVSLQAASLPAGSAVAGPVVPLLTATTQRSILAIQVDQIDSPAPRLEGVWMLIYLPPAPPLTLLPIFPSSEPTLPGQDVSLEAVFRLDENGRPAQDFLQALTDRDLRWDNILVLDEDGLAEVVELSGGLSRPLTGKNGLHAVAGLVMPWDNQAAALTGQANLLHQICLNGTQLAKAVSPKGLLRLLGQHMRTDLSAAQFSADWNNLLHASTEFTCEFPTLQDQAADLPAAGETSTPLPIAPWARP